nr:MADS-box transcription factor 23-like isoform X1 [Ipomoea batatas]
MMGEELTGLSVKDLQSLENQLEMSLRGVRTRKVRNSNFSQIGRTRRSGVPPANPNLDAIPDIAQSSLRHAYLPEASAEEGRRRLNVGDIGCGFRSVGGRNGGRNSEEMKERRRQAVYRRRRRRCEVAMKKKFEVHVGEEDGEEDGGLKWSLVVALAAHREENTCGGFSRKHHPRHRLPPQHYSHSTGDAPTLLPHVAPYRCLVAGERPRPPASRSLAERRRMAGMPRPQRCSATFERYCSVLPLPSSAAAGVWRGDFVGPSPLPRGEPNHRRNRKGITLLLVPPARCCRRTEVQGRCSACAVRRWEQRR